ncbi:uncharacterized protein LOC106012570, partial [Aplysia californica]|uniref:Uncharacterized protein LOC106012570 n=1 Tax=Aplysia californica TaxID=6500 RepID=A0ABM1A5R4_APLCA
MSENQLGRSRIGKLTSPVWSTLSRLTLVLAVSSLLWSAVDSRISCPRCVLNRCRHHSRRDRLYLNCSRTTYWLFSIREICYGYRVLDLTCGDTSHLVKLTRPLVHPACSQRVTAVRMAKCRENFLTEVSMGNLVSLHALTLEYNRMMRLPPIVHQLPVTKLTIGGNPLPYLCPGDLPPSLNYLKVTNTKLRLIFRLTLAATPHLTSLFLAQNTELTCIHKHAFRELTQLTRLDLQGTKVRSLAALADLVTPENSKDETLPIVKARSLLVPCDCLFDALGSHFGTKLSSRCRNGLLFEDGPMNLRKDFSTCVKTPIECGAGDEVEEVMCANVTSRAYRTGGWGGGGGGG